MTAKIFRNAFLIGFTVLLACILLFFFIMYSNYQAQAYDILEVEAEHIAEGMQICGGEEYLAAMQSDERITWIAPDGSVLYDNMADADTMENHLQRPEVQGAFETGSGRSDRYSSTILEKNNYYARLLKDGTVLRVAGKQTSVAAMALMLVQPSLWIVVLVLVLCGLLAMRLAKQIVRPINAINPDNPNATPTYPELQPLISRLQEQNRTIRTQLSELSTRQREFDAITENMREGFLIVDDKCNILSSNRSALRLLGIDGTPKPENLHQAVCSGELLTLVDQDALNAAVAVVVGNALEAFNASREREGAALAAILSKNCDTIEEVVAAVAERIPDIHRNLKEKLEQRLQEALGTVLSGAGSISREEVSDRIRQEVTFYALKMDVTEEINRLRTHVAEVRRILKEGGAAGRRLDFVTQEMNREANTLGSKSAAIEMTDAAVALKLCIDQMREQLQNIE